MLPAAPWRPGDLVHDETDIAGPCAALSFGHNDPGYDLIAQKLASRNCTTVAHIREWHTSEFISAVRPLQPELKKCPRAH